MSLSCSLLWLLVVWCGTSIGRESYGATGGPSWMTASSFCLSSNNSWILELHIWDTLPAGHGLAADLIVIVKGEWVLERQRRESNSKEYFFTNLFTWKWYAFFFFSFFTPLGHLGLSPLVSNITNFNSYIISPTDTWKVWKFLKTDSSHKVDTKSKVHWLGFYCFPGLRQVQFELRLSELWW